MLTKVTYKDNLFLTGSYTEFKRNGELVAQAWNGKIEMNSKAWNKATKLSRAQGYKYWKRYFPNRLCWDLPEALQEAIESEATTYGTYTNRHGEIIGYEG